MVKCKSCGCPLISMMVGLGPREEVICPACYNMLLIAEVRATWQGQVVAFVKRHVEP